MALGPNDCLGVSVRHPSRIRLTGPNAIYTTSANGAYYFPVLVEKSGSDIELVNDPFYGTTFYIRTAGMYLVEINLCTSTALYIGAAKNTDSAFIQNVNESNRISIGRVAASTPFPVVGVAYLVPGDFVRLHGENASSTPTAPSSGGQDQRAQINRIG